MSEKSTIEEMRLVAQSKGGKCLSKKYKNDSVKLLWQWKCREVPPHILPERKGFSC